MSDFPRFLHQKWASISFVKHFRRNLLRSADFGSYFKIGSLTLYAPKVWELLRLNSLTSIVGRLGFKILFFFDGGGELPAEENGLSKVTSS